MSERITIRARRRYWDSFVLHAEEKTVAEMFQLGYVGPFPRTRLVELIFRAKAIRIVAGSIDVTLPLCFDDGTPVESVRDVMKRWLGVFEGDPLPLKFFDSATGSFFAWPNPPGNFREILKDENGEYWVRAGYFNEFAIANDLSLTSLVVLGLGAGAGGGGSVDYAGGLVYSYARTTPFLAHISSPGSSVTTCTISISEFWPYERSDGLAAWDTATGEEDNGGPVG